MVDNKTFRHYSAVHIVFLDCLANGSFHRLFGQNEVMLLTGFVHKMPKRWLFLKIFSNNSLYSFESTLLMSAAWVVNKACSKEFSQEKPIYWHFWWKKDNSHNTISAKKSVKRTVRREPRKTVAVHVFLLRFYPDFILNLS